jgi:hypothetical protein
MTIKNTYVHLPLQDFPKITQIGIFGLKIYHLATLVPIFYPFSLFCIAKSAKEQKRRSQGGPDFQ